MCRRSHSTRPSRHLFFFPTLLPHPALSRTARVRARSSKISPFIVVTAPLLRCSTVPLLVAFQPWIRRRTAQKPATAQPTAQCRPPCSPEIPRHRTDPRTIFEPHPFHATSTDCTTSGFGANNPIVYAPDRDQTAATPASTVVPSGSTSTPPQGEVAPPQALHLWHKGRRVSGRPSTQFFYWGRDQDRRRLRQRNTCLV